MNEQQQGKCLHQQRRQEELQHDNERILGQEHFENGVTSPTLPLQLQANHAAMLPTTEAHLNTRKNICAHNLKLHKLIKLLRTEYPTVAPSMLVPLTQEQKYAYGGIKYYKNEFDILYALKPSSLQVK